MGLAMVLQVLAAMIGFEKRTIWEFLLSQRGLKNHFGTAAAEAAA
jgi:hypothetical protein